jgi:hypothetical protein
MTTKEALQTTRDLANSIRDDYTSAIAVNGTRPIYDRGVSSIFDVKAATGKLTSLPVGDVATVLRYLLTHDDGRALVAAIILSWDDRDDFDDLLAQDPRFKALY